MSKMWLLPFRNANRRNMSTHAIIKPSVGVLWECSGKADYFCGGVRKLSQRVCVLKDGYHVFK